MTNGSAEAFARSVGSITSQDYDTGASGLTVREYMATAIASGLVAKDYPHHLIAREAVMITRALINELNAPVCPQCKLSNSDKHYDSEHDLCSISERARSEQG